MTDTSSPLTLWHLFFDIAESPGPTMVTLEAHPAMAGVRERLSKASVGGLADALKDSLAGSLRDVLSTPMDQVVGAAWSTYGDVLEYADADKHPASEVSLVPLVSHTIESTHEPYLEILIDGKPEGRIDFDVRVAVTIDGATLKIQAGKIWEVRTGSCSAEGRVLCGPATLAKREARELVFPGKLSFPSGIQIAAANQD
jgi:hypothetical protein